MEKESEYSEGLCGEPEMWEAWESVLVICSTGVAIVAIAILGWLINSYILP